MVLILDREIPITKIRARTARGLGVMLLWFVVLFQGKKMIWTIVTMKQQKWM